MSKTGDRNPGTGYERRRAANADAPASVYAAIDLGTNNCRLLMGTPRPGGFRVVGSYSRIVRLGEGLAETGRLGDAAIARTVRALGVCAGRIRQRGAVRVRAVATEACRRAANGRAALDHIEAETGIRLELVSHLEEARLTVAGCARLVDPRFPRAIVFDIGGGSTEIMWIQPGAGGPTEVIGILSLPYGVVTLAERHGGGVLKAADREDLVGRIEADLVAFDKRHGIAGDIAAGRVQMLGTSGTMTMLACVHLGLRRYDRQRVNGVDLDFASIARVSDDLTAMDLVRRARQPCIGRQRADLVSMGCFVLEALRRRWPVGRLRVADQGVREGLLLGMMADDGRGAPVMPVAGPPADAARPRTGPS